LCSPDNYRDGLTTGFVVPSPRKAYRLAEHVPEVLALVRGNGLDAPPQLVQWVLMRYDEMQRAWRSERATQALRERRVKGVRYTRHAGYGFRWAGRHGHQRRVPDHEERRVMAAILRWWQEGCSYYDIARHLLLNRIKTGDGREWSPSRVRRAFLAAINSAIALGPPDQPVAG
jgi:hypothetical protein